MWAKELRDDFKLLKNKVEDLVLPDSETEDEESYYYQRDNRRHDQPQRKHDTRRKSKNSDLLHL